MVFVHPQFQPLVVEDLTKSTSTNATSKHNNVISGGCNNKAINSCHSFVGGWF